jgi:hypothetical protein
MNCNAVGMLVMERSSELRAADASACLPSLFPARSLSSHTAQQQSPGPNIQHLNPAVFGAFLFRVKIITVKHPDKIYNSKPFK